MIIIVKYSIFLIFAHLIFLNINSFKKVKKMRSNKLKLNWSYKMEHIKECLMKKDWRNIIEI